MKLNKLNRAISTALLICFVLQAIPVVSQAAENGIFFNHSTVRKLYTDLSYHRQCAGRLELCNQDRSLLEKQIANRESMISGLQQDKTAYQAESERFKTLYVKTDQDRIKAESDSPSRFRWFMAGFLTAVAAGIAAALAAK